MTLVNHAVVVFRNIVRNKDEYYKKIWSRKLGGIFITKAGKYANIEDDNLTHHASDQIGLK